MSSWIRLCELYIIARATAFLEFSHSSRLDFECCNLNTFLYQAAESTVLQKSYHYKQTFSPPYIKTGCLILFIMIFPRAMYRFSWIRTRQGNHALIPACVSFYFHDYSPFSQEYHDRSYCESCDLNINDFSSLWKTHSNMYRAHGLSVSWNCYRCRGLGDQAGGHSSGWPKEECETRC